jgi:multidrug efflux pump subunit AcrB
MNRVQDGYAWLLHGVVWARWLVLLAYLAVPVGLVAWWAAGHSGLGIEIFPRVDSGQFQLRVRAPDGTLLEDTEALARDVLAGIALEAGGEENVAISVSLVGTASYNYPINAIFLWTAGPQEAVLRVALRRESGIRVEDFKNRLREALPRMARQRAPAMKDVHLQFEAGDIVEQVMSFGSPTPVQVAVNGPNLEQNRAYAEKLRQQLSEIPSLRDLQYEQSLDYPTIEVNVNRELAGLSGVTAEEVGRALAPATLSSRFTTPLFWRDPKSGIGYQVQLEVPQAKMNSMRQVEQVPVKVRDGTQLLVEDVAQVRPGTMPGQIDRFNMKRMISLTANVEGEDLARVAGRIDRAIAAAGELPRGATVQVRGQVHPLRQTFGGLAGGPAFEGLTGGLVLSVVVILLLLIAYFQSVGLAVVVVSTTPAVIAGVVLALLATRTTLNLQSFMGAIMAIGVAVANAILLATFAEQGRREGRRATEAAIEGARHRLRPILMTSCAMIAGMVPMALGLGESGEQTAPLGRAVIGGLLVATMATLFLLPAVFAIVQGHAGTRSASLDPDDPDSPHYDRGEQSADANGRVQEAAPAVPLGNPAT